MHRADQQGERSKGWDRPKRASGRREAPTDRVAHEPSGLMDIQLLHDSVSVRFCRIEADFQESRDLFRRLAFSDELQYLAFPWRERIIRGVLGPDLRNNLCEVGAYIGRS